MHLLRLHHPCAPDHPCVMCSRPSRAGPPAGDSPATEPKPVSGPVWSRARLEPGPSRSRLHGAPVRCGGPCPHRRGPSVPARRDGLAAAWRDGLAAGWRDGPPPADTQGGTARLGATHLEAARGHARACCTTLGTAHHASECTAAINGSRNAVSWSGGAAHRASECASLRNRKMPRARLLIRAPAPCQHPHPPTQF